MSFPLRRSIVDASPAGVEKRPPNRGEDTTGSKAVRLTIPVEAFPQPRTRPFVLRRRGGGFVTGAGGRPVIRQVTDSRSPVHGFRKLVELSAAGAVTWSRSLPFEGPVELLIFIIFPRPKNRTTKKGPNPREWHASKPDGENCSKAISDALNSRLFRDDAQVARLLVEKVYGRPGEIGRTIVYAAELTEKPAELHFLEEGLMLSQ